MKAYKYEFYAEPFGDPTPFGPRIIVPGLCEFGYRQDGKKVYFTRHAEVPPDAIEIDIPDKLAQKIVSLIKKYEEKITKTKKLEREMKNLELDLEKNTSNLLLCED